MGAQRNARNEIEIDKFIHLKREKTGKKQLTRKKTTRDDNGEKLLDVEKVATYRDQRIYSQEAKCDISALIQNTGGSRSALKKLFLQVIQDVYPEEISKHAKPLLQALRARASALAKEGQTAFYFYQIYPTEKSLRSIYIKMLKGTQSYQFGDTAGYPPLEDLFVLFTDYREPICFKETNPIFLKAIFGEKNAGLILSEEKTGKLKNPFMKHTSLSEQDISELLPGVLFSREIIQWKGPSSKSGKKHIGKDRGTGIQITIQR